jgi:two-component system CheB/CheR fusion protein
MHPKSIPRKKRQAAAAAQPISRSSSTDNFPIVAIGASAGGIEAFTELIRELPPDTGMAFVLIQHLDPHHHSMLAELFSRQTVMSVTEITDNLPVEPNHTYVIPPNASLTISNRTLHLGPRIESRGVHMETDRFMRSLAEDQGSRAIGVILSGTGSDGTLGMIEIQAHGGITFAQDESTAGYDGMPRSAIASGCVDYVLPPAGIADELARVAHHPYVERDPVPEKMERAPAGGSALKAIFEMLRRANGLDFTHYRQTTVLRRIQRRMVVHKIERLEDYVKHVQSSPAEVKALYQDMLINVTSFFRNPRVFEALKSQVFPHLLRNRPAESAIRIWTPGCSSGEETYSVAMALLEFLDGKAAHSAIQLFGTDVSEGSVAKARVAVYPENIQGDVSPERLRRFFAKHEGGYRISKGIRDMCIFAQHNVVNDPPFSQMDLICCRNLLIYLEPVLQSKVLALFHYASSRGGYLVLGTSESLGNSTNLFAVEDRALRIFSKKATAARPHISFALGHHSEPGEAHGGRFSSRAREAGWNYLEAQKEFDRRLLTQFAPAAVFLNEDLEVIHSRGTVDRYLKLAPGRASLSILKMVREGLLLDLRNALGRAKKENAIVKKQRVQLESGSLAKGEAAGEAIRFVNFEVIPIGVANLPGVCFMVVFQDAPAESEGRKHGGHSAGFVRESESAARRLEKLKQELVSTKEYLQSVIETQEAANEEVQSANEEILSSNEELQSTNEELETAKEELQSSNEELSTVNDELRERNLETAQVNNDLTNLLASVDIAMVMVASDLTIRRFTPKAQKLLGLIPGDVGRPIQSINPALEIPEFQQMVSQVMAELHSVEKDLTDRGGAHHLLRILPYRTAENKIEGAVITIVDLIPKALAGGN